MERRVVTSTQGRSAQSVSALERLEQRLFLAVQPLNIGEFKGRPGQYGQFNGITLFTTSDLPSGQKLWYTDGTPTGTFLVKDLDASASTPAAWFVSGRDNALAVGGVFYFTGVTNAHGRELWRSDGTPQGTFMVKDLVPGDEDSNPEGFVALGNQLIFSADKKLWRSDGTPQGTRVLKNADPLGSFEPERMAELNGYVYFTIYPSQSPYNGSYNTGELWRTDGTVDGTELVRDLSSGVDPTNVTPSRAQFVNSNGAIYFSANDGEHGWELWRTDGTKKGTVLVRDLAPPGPNPFEDGSYPRNISDVNGTLLFSADGFLWKSNGTKTGTTKLRSVTNPRGFVAVNGLLFFSSGDALWKSDFTRDGTVHVANVEPSERFGTEGAASLNGRIYFGASGGGNGFELYESDGTALHTTLAFEAEPGPTSSNALALGRYAERIIFTARNDATATWQVYALSIPNPHSPRDLRLATRTNSGISELDHITSSTKPIITGSAPADSLVQVFADGVEIGRTLAPQGVFEIALSNHLADGLRSIRAVATDDLGRTSALSDPLNLQIDTTPPAVRFKAISQHLLELKFSEDVSATFTRSDLTLKNLTSGSVISQSSVQATYNRDSQAALVSFPRLVAGLPAGSYELSINTPGVRDAAGNRLTSPSSFTFTPPSGPVVGVSSRVLRITGTNGNDQIIIRRQAADPSRIAAVINGKSSNYAETGITEIRIHALGGNDLVRFDNSNGAVAISSAIYGEAGNDTIFASLGRDRINGNAGDDELHGAGGNDIIYGGTGKDRIFGDAGNDYLVGGAAVDVIQGNRGADRLFVQSGIDEVTSDKLDNLLIDAA